jgi:hypothetical protein
VARSRGTELPPPLPPDQRTVGQLVAESVRLYGRHVWRSLAIGLPPAALSVAVASLSRTPGLAVFVAAGGVVLTASYVGGVVIAYSPPLDRRRLLTAFVVGVLVFAPFSVLVFVYVLPGLAWLALFGLAVPAALVEGLGLRASLARGLLLGRADFVHALGGLCALAIVVVASLFLTALALQNFADNTARVAGFLAGVVISPILFLGAAILYEDQAARLSAVAGTRRGDASGSGPPAG